MQIVKPTASNIIIKERETHTQDQVLKFNEESSAKRKHLEDEDKDTDKLTLLNGLSIPKDGNVSAFKKRKKIATADKVLKLEQEKV